MSEARIAAEWEGLSTARARAGGGEGRARARLLARLVGAGIKTFTATTARPVVAGEPTLSRSGSARRLLVRSHEDLVAGELTGRYRELEAGSSRSRGRDRLTRPGASAQVIVRTAPSREVKTSSAMVYSFRSRSRNACTASCASQPEHRHGEPVACVADRLVPREVAPDGTAAASRSASSAEVAPRASRPTRRRRHRSSVSGTTRFTRPHSSACPAGISSHRKTISRARRSPTISWSH